ncbi:MAG: hypothetical protein N2Z80_04285 [Hydrogenothermaceae bacterium]|nr:hypothetical protein [Hydrogenothermaceae bacterium]
MENRNIDDLIKEIDSFKKRYSRYMSEKERKRKREQDVHLTKKDRMVLIESFVIGGVIENALTKILPKIL